MFLVNFDWALKALCEHLNANSTSCSFYHSNVLTCMFICWGGRVYEVDWSSRVIAETDSFVVLDKPAGVSVCIIYHLTSNVHWIYQVYVRLDFFGGICSLMVVYLVRYGGSNRDSKTFTRFLISLPSSMFHSFGILGMRIVSIYNEFCGSGGRYSWQPGRDVCNIRWPHLGVEGTAYSNSPDWYVHWRMVSISFLHPLPLQILLSSYLSKCS